MTLKAYRSLLALCALTFVAAQAQTPGGLPPPGSPPEHGPQRPPLLFREEWKQAPGGGEHPVSAASVGNPNLELTLIAPGGQIMITGIPGDENNPLHTWSGLCTTPCGSHCATGSTWPTSAASPGCAGRRAPPGYHQGAPDCETGCQMAPGWSATVPMARRAIGS